MKPNTGLLGQEGVVLIACFVCLNEDVTIIITIEDWESLAGD